MQADHRWSAVLLSLTKPKGLEKSYKKHFLSAYLENKADSELVFLELQFTGRDRSKVITTECILVIYCCV